MTGAVDPYATWDPAQATDLPDGLPDTAIVPLVETLRGRGVVTLQSCAGHPGTDDGTLWIGADSVDETYLRDALINGHARELFDRIQLVMWPERRWEFIWQPDRAADAMAALERGLRPLRPGPCVFCSIVAGTTQARVVQRWPDAIAIVPLDPVTDGHLLVLPRLHVQDVTANPQISAAALARAAEIAEPPCNIITSAGSEATQSVGHLHWHIVPRRSGDDLPLPWTAQHHARQEESPAREVSRR